MLNRGLLSLLSDHLMDILDDAPLVVKVDVPACQRRKRRTSGNDDKFHLKLRTPPGFRGCDVKLNVVDGKLRINAERREGESDDDCFKMEFHKSVELPGHVDAERLDHYWTKDGHLMIEAPKKKPRVDATSEQQLVEKDEPRCFTATLDLSTFLPEEVTVRLLDDRRVQVIARRERQSGFILSIDEIHREVLLPKEADVNQLRSFFCPDGYLKVEAPLRPLPPPSEDDGTLIPVQFVEERQE